MKTLIEKILKKENIQYSTLTKSTSGFTNQVFFVDNQYVIKVVSQNTKPEKLQKEIAFYQNVKLDNIPQYIASGNCEGVDYLIISKLNGQSLYSIWHTLDSQTRNNIIYQIADILNNFHTKAYEFLPEKYKKNNWQENWQKSFDLNIDILEKRGFDVWFLKDFRQIKLSQVFSQQRLGLVYNDAHFDNFLFDGEKVYLIDFDRVLYSSIDYELLIIKSMLDNPCKFASEIDEPNVNIDDYQGIWEILKYSCQDMFDFEYLMDRVFIYQFIYNLGNSYEYDHDDWIEVELNKFKERFGY